MRLKLINLASASSGVLTSHMHLRAALTPTSEQHCFVCAPHGRGRTAARTTAAQRETRKKNGMVPMLAAEAMVPNAAPQRVCLMCSINQFSEKTGEGEKSQSLPLYF